MNKLNFFHGISVMTLDLVWFCLKKNPNVHQSWRVSIGCMFEVGQPKLSVGKLANSNRTGNACFLFHFLFQVQKCLSIWFCLRASLAESLLGFDWFWSAKVQSKRIRIGQTRVRKRAVNRPSQFCLVIKALGKTRGSITRKPGGVHVVQSQFQFCLLIYD